MNNPKFGMVSYFMIKHSKPTIDNSEKELILRILERGEIGFTDSVEKFEDELARKTGNKYAIATNSGSSAIHLALLTLNVKEDDEVIIPSYCCSALLNAINYVGAKCVFADIYEHSFNINTASVRKYLSKKTKAVIVPHLFGLPADIDEIKSFGIRVIEDCAMTLFAQLKSKPVGTFGDIVVTSFYATKLITTGIGGAVLTNSKKFANTIRDLINYDKRYTYKIRYNYKMTALQAEMGIAQLNKIDKIIKARKSIAQFYKNALKEWEEYLPAELPDRDHIFYRFVVRSKNSVEHAIKFFKKHNIEIKRPIFKPMHHYFGKSYFYLPETDKVYDSVFSIPIYPHLKNTEMKKVADVLSKFFGALYESR